MYLGSSSKELDTQLALLYRRESEDLTIEIGQIQQQRGGADCGLFSAAVCTALAAGQDPTQCKWRQARMRSHLSECIRTEILKPFPIIERKKDYSSKVAVTKTNFTIQLWCICRLPSYAFNNMVECEKCKKWFHKPCVGIPDTECVVDVFYCRLCDHVRLTL